MVTIWSSSLDSLSLCVDVLRGNRTTTESAVITRLKLVSRAWRYFLTNSTRTWADKPGSVRTAWSPQVLYAPPLSLTTGLFHPFERKTAPLASNERRLRRLPVFVLQNKTLSARKTFASCCLSPDGSTDRLGVMHNDVELSKR